MRVYCDNGLVILRGANGQKKKTKQQRILKELFKNIGFQREESIRNQFLNVTFILTNGTFLPYKQPNDKLLHVHTSSNHSPQIMEQF